MTQTFFEDIHLQISGELEKAVKEINVAMAWFTDRDLMNSLCNAQSKGVQVTVILSDNDINRQTNFQGLLDAGVKLVWYPQNGFGQMHHKFCVIDDQVVITGSYNWTNNAKNNNGENIVVLTDIENIEKYSSQFVSLLQEGIEGVLDQGNNGFDVQKYNGDVVTSIDSIWDTYSNSKVGDFDREALQSVGLDRANSTQGNPSVINEQLDTLYQSLLLDTVVNGDDRFQLCAKIETKSNELEHKLKTSFERQTTLAESKKLAQQKDLENQVIVTENKVKTAEIAQGKIKQIELPNITDQIESTRSKAVDISLDQVKIPLRRRVFVELFFLLGLSVYLVVFYSSVIYTILYGTEDAKNISRELGVAVNIEVFNPNALAMALERGGANLFFCLLFVAIPMLMGYLAHRAPGKFVQRSIYLIAILFDAILAILIAKGMHEYNYEIGTTSHEWSFILGISSYVFWLVIFLGLVPYMLWGMLVDNVYMELDKVSRSNNFHKNEKRIELLREEQDVLEGKKHKFHLDIEDFNQTIADYETEIKALQRSLAFLPHECECEKEKANKNFDNEINSLFQKKEIALRHLEKDHIPVSYNALKDRINVFLIGWNEWLYSYYSIHLADKKSREAHEIANQWIVTKESELI